jgi:tetratricopeptide (TPR) repeat protein
VSARLAAHRRALALLPVLLLAPSLTAGLTAVGPETRPLPFISDDYPAALAAARSRGLPLFFEAWAPWCHTCRSMRAFVLSDAALAGQASRFVWLELNTDLSRNESALRLHEADALPTFLVVDPKDESVVLRWVGSFTVSQAETFLAEAHEKLGGRHVPATPADVALLRADREYGARRYASAAVAYREALAQAAPEWPARARASEALLYSLQQTQAFAEAVAFTREALPRLQGTPSALVVALGGLDGALELAEDAAARGAVAELEASLRAVLADPRLRVSADDRSNATASLVAARRALGDAAGARRQAEEWAALLEAEVAREEDADKRAVFDSHRLSAYLELGQAEKAVPMLLASEKTFPDDYNPPNRLARAYAALGRWPEALAASDRAIPRSTGRARLRVLATRGELLQQQGDTAGARRAYDDALTYGEALPAGERPLQQLERLRKLREKLSSSSAPAP